MRLRVFSSLILILLSLRYAAPVKAQGYGESPYIFGVHDPEGANSMADKKRGWILFTEALGRDPNNRQGRDYRQWADAGFGILVRLNHGYGPVTGGIPYRKHYDGFAQRVANFVAASPGAHIWILGNEMNWDQEWPGYEGFTEMTTPDLYVELFRNVRARIKAIPGHIGDQVIPGAIGTYGRPVAGYGFVEYHVRVLELLGSSNLDGIALHTYTHGTNPNLIFDETRMGPPYQNRYYNFRAYRDYLNAHPAWARSLPVYITETDQVDPWANTNSGWVRNAYREINDWNQIPGTQKVRAVALYRFCCDQWNITGKGGVIEDFRQAMDNDYRWTGSGGTDCKQSVTADRWKAEYFPNIDLFGSPSIVSDAGTGGLALDWGASGPNRCGIGSDRFSARFTRTLNFSAGTYRFTTQVDDGIRLYVNTRLVLDRWFDQAPTTYMVDVPLGAGNHTLEAHYYENGGGAAFQLGWSATGGGGSQPLASEVLETQSAIPASLAPGETRSVTVRVQNTGSATWTAGEMFRLGAGPSNNVTWSGFSCGGFSNGATNQRVYLCGSVAPGGVHDFTCNVTAPASGGAVFSVQMVKELVAWFGERRDWSIPLGGGNPCSQTVAAGRWKGEYFTNTLLSGSPQMTRDDGNAFLTFDWGSGSPGASCGMGVDNFSTRWTRTVDLAAGTYRFTARTDDGMRVFVDNVLRLDKWFQQAPTTYTFEVALSAGSHILRVEFYEAAGGATAQLSWEQVGGGGNGCLANVGAGQWKGEYWNNRNFSGSPVRVRDDGAGFLNFDWGGGSPDAGCGVPADGFSARWSRTTRFEAATYRFTVVSDDGFRLFVDGASRLEKWFDQAPATYTVDVALTAGDHAVRLDYYENGGGAVSKLSWANVGGGGGGGGATAASKLTLHTGFTGPLSMQFIASAKPRILKILDNFGPAAQVKSVSPGTLIIGRIYEPNQPQDGDPVQRANEWWARNQAKIMANPAVDYWEGYNEPSAGTVEILTWYGRSEAARVNLLAQNGKKACIGNFSMGVPDVTNPAMWPAFYPAIDAARQQGGILGLHEYGTPMQQYFDSASGEGWLCGRYRKVYRQHLIPTGRSLPLAITETGVDGVPPTGWKNHYTGDQYLSQLQWYDSLMRQDSYVLGGTIFSLEIPGWGDFDIAPIVGPLTDYVRNSR